MEKNCLLKEGVWQRFAYSQTFTTVCCVLFSDKKVITTHSTKPTRYPYGPELYRHYYARFIRLGRQRP